MARNMSFMLTTEQIRNKTKHVTRRHGWLFIKPGDILNAVEKCQGLKKGEKIKHICQIRVLSVTREPLNKITKHELIREGFPEMTPKQFVTMFCKSHKKVLPDSVVTRVEFGYL